MSLTLALRKMIGDVSRGVLQALGAWVRPAARVMATAIPVQNRQGPLWPVRGAPTPPRAVLLILEDGSSGAPGPCQE